MHKFKIFESKFLRIGVKNENFKNLGHLLQFKKLSLVTFSFRKYLPKFRWISKYFPKIVKSEKY